MITKRQVIWVCLALLLVGLLVSGCSQQKAEQTNYPESNINGIISWGVGGVMDNVSRSIGPIAEKQLGKSIIMTNKTGATGAVATQYVFDQKSNGYTLLFHAENPQLYKVLELSKLDYADFEPIILLGKGLGVIVTYKDSPINTIDDLIAEIKQNPQHFNMGSTGVGGLPQVTTALLMEKENFNVNFVSYDGEGPLVAALLGKQVNACPLSVGTAAQYIKSGDLKALAIVSNAPIEILPDIPALGVIKPEYQESLKTFGPFYGVYVKKDTPADIIKKLQEAFEKSFNDPKFGQFMKESGIIPLGIQGDEAKKYLKTWQSQHAWLLHSVGATKVSPETVGIPKLPE